MLDLAFAAHGFSEIVPSFLFTFSTHLVLFRAIDNIAKVKNLLPKFDFIKAQKFKINKRALKGNAHFFRIIQL